MSKRTLDETSAPDPAAGRTEKKSKLETHSAPVRLDVGNGHSASEADAVQASSAFQPATITKRRLDETSTTDPVAEPAGKKIRLDTDSPNGHAEAGSGPDITKAEADLYDRQIRLWGLDAQQRMRHSKILVIGVTGLSNEICKNLVLSGVGGLTVISSDIVEESDLSVQFFLRETDIGTNLAKAVAPRIQALNPRVQVDALTFDVHKQPSKFFDNFDVICCCNVARYGMIRINNICRGLGKKFYAVDTAGVIGYIFCDLYTHKFVESKKSSGRNDAVKSTFQKTYKYQALEQVLESKWGMLNYAALSKREKRAFNARVDPVYFAFNVLWQFEEETNGVPNADDFERLRSVRDTFMRSVECDPAYVSDDLLRCLTKISYAHGELAAVCAVLGGYAAQDILKVISAKDAPFDNFFAFNGTAFSGKQLKLGKLDQVVVEINKPVKKPVETIVVAVD
ncbi:E1 ubiquitin-activating protein aos1 [Geranomyces variabilis]|uniref:Ubiquitin-like 1-activating enzyme E1A n=1 Tax=Geranomyces variabilis TaxID=109894 RepID=A0AAD5XQY2_9FUNG|nr:E1 ubiquitin-activating protein aos1 [Geranomyces variabilis]